MLSWTNTRDPAIQHYPILYIIALHAKLAALFISLSGQTITGDFPPSSRVTFLRLVYALASIILRPTKVEPVKETLLTL